MLQSDTINCINSYHISISFLTKENNLKIEKILIIEKS